MRELLNESIWFMKKTNKERFEKPQNEEHGEDDATSVL